MADEHKSTQDIAAHKSSYDSFLGWLKFGTIASAIVTIFVILIIT